MSPDGDEGSRWLGLVLSAYQDTHHFWLWPVPLLGFAIAGVAWVLIGEWVWYGWTWLAGADLAFLSYSPFLLLPG